MKDIYLCLDVGGTEIKAAPVDAGGALLQPLRHFPARSHQSAPTLLDHFASVLQEISPGQAISGIRLAFPGPFDYEAGICLLQGLGKFDALYGVNLRHALACRMDIEPEAIRFANDASAFALGELGFGLAKAAPRAMFICIGTGCGSAFGVGGALAPLGTPGVPACGCVYSAPFLEGRVDDYLSRRGLEKLTQEYLGMPLDGKSLAHLAQEGNCQAQLCFLAFGRQIRDALSPFLVQFRPDVLCFGGQITRSASFFLKPMEHACHTQNVRLYITEDTSVRTLQGLTRI